MSFFSYALGTLILILVLLRQVRVRPVPRVFQPRLPVVIGRHRPLRDVLLRGRPPRLGSAPGSGCSARWWSARWPGRAARALHAGVGGQRLGAAPGQRASPWRCGSCRCWCTSPATPGGATPGAPDWRGRASCSTWALTLGVQYYVVYRRALPLWAQLGPDAGRPLQVQFTPGARGVLRDLPHPRRGTRCPGGLGTARRRDGDARRPERD